MTESKKTQRNKEKPKIVEEMGELTTPPTEAQATVPAEPENADEKEKEQDKKKPTPNILKCRDDQSPISFLSVQPTEEKPDLPAQFKLTETSLVPSWATRETPFATDVLRSRIEPWLTALCQSEHLSLLIGSGLTHAVFGNATGQILPGMGSTDNWGTETECVAKAVRASAEAAQRREGNIEDQIRVVNELLRGLEILGKTDDSIEKRASCLRDKLSIVIGEFAASILRGEQELLKADGKKREDAFNLLVSFLMSFASRTGTRDRLHIFTTNYDRYIEVGADLAGLHLLDRFVGSISPVFRSSRLDLDIHYNPPGIRGEPRYLEGVARFTKLHGSLDWIQSGNQIHRIGIPFGSKKIDPYLEDHDSANPFKLMIFPNAAKDRETALFPYVELFRDLASAICRPNHTLITFGYSFGDEHINRVIEDMLTIPSTHLVLISRSDPMNRIMATYEKTSRHDQMTLMIGEHVGDFKNLVDLYLPKSAIDRATFRMMELLKQRFPTHEEKHEPKPEVTAAPPENEG